MKSICEAQTVHTCRVKGMRWAADAWRTSPMHNMPRYKHMDRVSKIKCQSGTHSESYATQNTRSSSHVRPSSFRLGRVPLPGTHVVRPELLCSAMSPMR